MPLLHISKSKEDSCRNMEMLQMRHQIYRKGIHNQRRKERGTYRGITMTAYKCFQCEKKVGDEYLRTKVRCPYCGSKLLYKERKTATKIKAR